MTSYFHFDVGEEEIHKVQYYDEYGGYLHVVMVDGEIISGTRFGDMDLFKGGAILPFLSSKYPDLKKGNEIEFEVGTYEVHHVKLKFEKKGIFRATKKIDIIIEVDGEVKDVIEDTEIDR